MRVMIMNTRLSRRQPEDKKSVLCLLEQQLSWSVIVKVIEESGKRGEVIGSDNLTATKNWINSFDCNKHQLPAELLSLFTLSPSSCSASLSNYRKDWKCNE